LGDEWAVSQTLDNLALIARVQGRFTNALQLSDEGISRRRQLNDKQGLAIALGNRARLMTDMGDLAAAERLYYESLLLAQEIDDRRGIVYCFIGLANVLSQLPQVVVGGWQRPYQLVLLAQRLLAEMAAQMEQDEQEIVAEIMTRAEQELDTAVIAAACAEVETMSVAELIQLLPVSENP
jgi:hypothetical protein